MSFADLKNKRGAAGLSNLQEKLEAIEKKERGKIFEKDPRFWTLSRGKDGVGAAVIRFLPEAEGETEPFVKLIEYAFKGPNGWYINKSLQNVGRKDPVNDMFSQLWNSGVEANKNKAKQLKRRAIFISNILVLKDPANPENEGKIFLFQYGKQIFDKIQETMFPAQDELDETPKVGVNVFCPWDGANFKIRIKTVDKIPNYLSSEFSEPTPLFAGNDEEIETLWKNQHQLGEFTDASNYPTYEQLEKRLNRVLGLSLPGSGAPASAEDVSSAAAIAHKTSPEAVESDADSDAEEDLSYLQSLVGDE